MWFANTKGEKSVDVCCLQHLSSSSQAGILPVARVSYGRRERQSQAAVQPTLRLHPDPGLMQTTPPF